MSRLLVHFCLAYSSISIFKHPSSSIGHEFIEGALNMGGSGEGGDNDPMTP
jgi:hypothetical protein